MREIGVFSEIRAWDITEQEIREFNPQGIILSGGPESVTDGATGAVRTRLCVHHGTAHIRHMLWACRPWPARWAGKVGTSDIREFGYAQVKVEEQSTLLGDLKDHLGSAGESLLDVWMSHGDKVVATPEGFTLMALHALMPNRRHGQRRKTILWYSSSITEVTHTLQGEKIFQHFALEICGCEPLWTAAAIIEDQINRVKEQVGDSHVLLGLSVVLIPLWLQLCCIKPLAISLPVCLLIMACCAKMKATWSWKCSPKIWALSDSCQCPRQVFKWSSRRQ